MEYIEIKEQIKQKLPVARDFGDSENLLELGLSSLTIMRLVNQWRKQGVKVSFGSLMENPTFEGWWALIQRSMKKKAGKKRAQESKITPEKDMKQPFPLTDVQYAYWVGRDEEQYLGGIDCHAYLEFDGENIEPERLEKAWNVLQYHHPMLRACFLDDGTQKILDKPYCEKIKVHDFSRMSSEEAEAMAVSVRERLSHRKLKIEEGEVAGIELTLFPENKARLHVDMALLVADVQSLQILLRDLASAYRGENLPKESKGWNFASYLERQKQEEGEERKNAEKYWKNRLEHLPKGPDLPLAKRPQEVEKTVFNRRIVRIEKEEWDHLQMRAKKYQTTPAMVLLTAYAVVLERWSRNHCFLINIPFFNRKTEQQGLEEVIADFTTLLLLEINCEENPTFAELLDRIQKQLHEDMKYTAYSGVQVQRDIAQMCGDASAVAPVVFACNLGTPLVNDTFRKELGQFSYMISQTPQVWNDFQSYEDENGVQLTWDSVDELFPENMIPDMLESFEILLHELGKKDWNQRFDVFPEKRKREVEDTAHTGVPERSECLHWAVMNHAEVCPEDIALIDAGSGRSVSYGELKTRATAVAAGISEKDIKGVPIALTLPRGIEQIEAALGILLSGNSYLPVSLSQPKDRRALIHEKTEVRYVVTNRELSEKLDWPEDTEILVMEGMEEGQENVKLPEVSPKDSAYIIMTSGSTGVPKGVEIAHESAWNTVQDINEKYHVTSADRALAVSAMDFDLSVYDVFGILGAGGTLVLLPEQERRNADYWLEQVLKYQITVWNSVPVLLEMLLIRAESMKQKLPIRAVMLSGDWIGMDLPERVVAWTEDCQFVAMGGATEATAAVLTVYGTVLKKWSFNKDVCLNLTVLNRETSDKNINKVVGDFTKILLLEIRNLHDTFSDMAQDINATLFESLDHCGYSGVDVIRDISKTKGREYASMPYVFTSAIGLIKNSLQGKYEGIGISQTPQVFIDCQAMDGDFGLQINWDVRKGVFENQLIRDMFQIFEMILNQLAADQDMWENKLSIALPEAQRKQREQVNCKKDIFDDKLLYTDFLKIANIYPNYPAIYDDLGTITYGELLKLSASIAARLQEEGVKENDKVVVMIPKNRYQIGAVLAVLYLGGAYVPIDITSPVKRTENIISQCNSSVVLKVTEVEYDGF